MAFTPSAIVYTPVTLTAPTFDWVSIPFVLVDPRPPAYITGRRLEGWQLDAITPGGDILATLPMIKGSGQHDWQLDRLNPLGLSCVIADRMPDGSPLPDLRGLWLRATHRINGTTYLLATVVVAAAPRSFGATSSTLKLSGIDPTVLLSRARLRKSLTLPVATPVAETVRDLIAIYAPTVRASIGDTDETLRTNLTFEAGTTILEIINTLLDAVAYNRLAPRTDGLLVASRWVPQSERAAVLTFDDATGAPYLPDVEMDDDYLSAPNEVLAIGQGGQDMPAVVGRWPDAPPLSPITEVIQTDATSIEAARMLARKYYDTAQATARSASFTGQWQPIEPGQIAGFTYGRHNVAGKQFELTALRSQWSTGPNTTYSLQEAS